MIMRYIWQQKKPQLSPKEFLLKNFESQFLKRDTQESWFHSSDWLRRYDPSLKKIS